MDSRRYQQNQLISVDGTPYEIVVRLGVVAGADHVQAQVAVSNPADQELLAEVDWPHLAERDAWQILPTLAQMMRQALTEATCPFPRWDLISGADAAE